MLTLKLLSILIIAHSLKYVPFPFSCNFISWSIFTTYYIFTHRTDDEFPHTYISHYLFVTKRVNQFFDVYIDSRFPLISSRKNYVSRNIKPPRAIYPKQSLAFSQVTDEKHSRVRIITVVLLRKIRSRWSFCE